MQATTIVNETFKGYCKVYNETRDIECKYEQLKYGLGLIKVDCNYEKCLYNKECSVVKQALAKEDE